MHDLNDLLLPGIRPDMPSARAINDSGQILITATVGGQHRALLLNPTPAPRVRLDRRSIAFDSQRVGTTSALQTVTITNTGDLPLTIAGVTLMGPDAARFAIVSDSGETTLAPGASRSVAMRFTPAAVGKRTASLAIDHNDSLAASPRSIALSGEGVDPSLSPSTVRLSFGDQRVGNSSPAQPIALTNTGRMPVVIQTVRVEGVDAADFHIDPFDRAPLTVGESRIFGVRFAPAARGSRNAVLSITSDAGDSPHRVSLSGQGIAPVVKLSPGSLAFGTQAMGSSDTQSVVLQNVGDAPLRLDTVAVGGENGSDFALAADGCTGQELPPGSICTLNVRFRPAAMGSRSARLVIIDDAAGSPHGVALSGTGGGAAIGFGVSRLSTPTTISFGPQTLSQPSGLQTLTITNTGTTPLTVGELTLSGPQAGEFAIASDSGEDELAAGAARTIAFRFTPRGTGGRAASLAFNSNVPGSPHRVSLTGTGILTSSGGSAPRPAAATLAVVAIDGTATNTRHAVISVSQSVTLKLQLKYPDGSTADVSTDVNTRFFANAPRGTFAAKQVWKPKPEDSGKTLVFYGRFYHPNTRRPYIDQVVVSVLPVRIRPGRRN